MVAMETVSPEKVVNRGGSVKIKGCPNCELPLVTGRNFWTSILKRNDSLPASLAFQHPDIWIDVVARGGGCRVCDGPRIQAGKSGCRCSWDSGDRCAGRHC